MYHEIIKPKDGKVPISRPLSEAQVKNEAGGYVNKVDVWTRLERFLIIGSEANTYYANKYDLTVQSYSALKECLKLDWKRAIQMIASISREGRSIRQQPAIFALAVAITDTSSAKGRKFAAEQIPAICRTGSSFFQFVEYANRLRGWGSVLRRGVANWYTGKEPQKLAYQMVKYRNRNGWSHHDVMHLAHPKPSNRQQQQLFYWAKTGDLLEEHPEEGLPKELDIIEGFEQAQRATSANHIVGLIESHGLTREMIPTRWLKSPEVWGALLQNMPITALIRNLGKLTQLGLAKPFSDSHRLIVDTLIDENRLRRGRVHPFTLLQAKTVYDLGVSTHGRVSWSPVGKISGAISEAFDLSFQYLEPSNKRILLGLDCSGSMRASVTFPGPGMPAVVAAGAWAYILRKSEPQTFLVGFDDKPIELDNYITERDSLGNVVQKLKTSIGGMTDYSVPIRYAQNRELPVDAFVIIGDEQTWRGYHPASTLRAYRVSANMPETKMLVANVCSYQTTVADESDERQLTVCGLDSAFPKLVSQFLAD